MNVRARVLALYLPQFHPIPENDEWWGPGFTEWTNVARARPLFRGHDQPHLPGELGFYDLRLPETRHAQAELAREHGVEAFVYWHYWFGGERLLERPFAEVLSSGEPDFPFCLAWANHSWTGVWYGAADRKLKVQTYPQGDAERHFAALIPALVDDRYVTVSHRPLVFVFKPMELPEPRRFTDTWRSLADKAGLPGLHLVGFAEQANWDPVRYGFDAAVVTRLGAIFSAPSRDLRLRLRRRLTLVPSARRIESRIGRPLHVHPYDKVAPLFLPPEATQPKRYPCVISNWDSTPRSGKHGSVLVGSNPASFEHQLTQAADRVATRPADDRLVILKSWNEWAEGNYVEPDIEYGRGWLEAVRSAVTKAAPGPLDG
jgi:hypothetical protein